eukprot:TRINITY_DN11399_c0_g1_i18.p1 TRINITY_DN11399_c0_g1~~TRINITY_DN11399_c0_g1_i18.p1  ORF type:complete len:144 (+),score=26.53 TRINITY_DN11399_c0_g1_i18:141-572(+)
MERREARERPMLNVNETRERPEIRDREDDKHPGERDRPNERTRNPDRTLDKERERRERFGPVGDRAPPPIGNNTFPRPTPFSRGGLVAGRPHNFNKPRREGAFRRGTHGGPPFDGPQRKEIDKTKVFKNKRWQTGWVSSDVTC